MSPRLLFLTLPLIWVTAAAPAYGEELPASPDRFNLLLPVPDGEEILRGPSLDGGELRPVPGRLEAPSAAGLGEDPFGTPSPMFPLAAKSRLPTVDVGGAFQVDSGWFGQDADSRMSVGDIQDGASFRRARLNASGSVMPLMDYRFEVDFAFFGRPTFTDLWFEVHEVPVLGSVRVGQWKQPFSLEVVSPFRYTTFAERSLLFPAFVPFRHIGAGFMNNTDDERMTWQASVYRSGQDQFGGSLADSGGYAGVGRFTFLPWYDDASGGRYYLHLGTAYNFTAPNDRQVRFRTIPEFYTGEQAPGPVGTSGVAQPGVFNGVPFFVDTGIFPAEHYHLVGTELLWVHGPFSLQSEFMHLQASRPAASDVGFQGIYVQAGYFLTGEHRPFNRPRAFIARIEPFRSIGIDGSRGRGWGAWELASRFSAIDLNDRDVRGGRLNNWTLGLNWYFNPYSKLQFNYIKALLNDPLRRSSETDIYALRAQLDF